MANAYTQLIVQIVIVVKYREALISEDIKDQVEKYITGIVQSKRYKLLTIYCMPDHTHILIGLNPDHSISELVRLIKCNSSKYINDEGLCRKYFKWQKGYGAFSYSMSSLSTVARYIENQKEHHACRPFQKEYQAFLKEFKIDYDERYTFRSPE